MVSVRPGGPALDVRAALGQNHGRGERRRGCATASAARVWLDPGQTRPGLCSVVAVGDVLRVGVVTTAETRSCPSRPAVDTRRFGIASLSAPGQRGPTARDVDLELRVDDRRARVGHAAGNIAVLRHVALSLPRQDRTTKTGFTGWTAASWDNAGLAPSRSPRAKALTPGG